MPDPKKNVAFTFDISLVDSANRPAFKASPTLAAGDFKVSIDEGAFNNLASLPTVSPAAGRNVKVALSQSEMNGDRIVVQCVDAAGGEWDDVVVVINTTAQTVDDLPTATQVNAEVVDALSVDTYAQPGQEAPAATTTLAKMLAYCYKAFRNKFTDDGTTAKLFADDGATVDQKATVSDDGSTYTRGEFGAGP